jgi:hypothetical protein
MLAVRTACERRQVVEIALEGPGKGTATPMQLDGPPDDPPRYHAALSIGWTSADNVCGYRYIRRQNKVLFVNNAKVTP